jgi:hypothetical protein
MKGGKVNYELPEYLASKVIYMWFIIICYLICVRALIHVANHRNVTDLSSRRTYAVPSAF